MENEQRKYWFFGSKLNSVLLLVLIVLMVLALREMKKNQDFYKQNLGLKDSYQIPVGDTAYEKDNENSYPTYTYTNHGFSIDLPKGFIPREEDSEGGPYTSIMLPDGNGVATYIRDMDWWKKYDGQVYSYLGTETINQNTFSIYKYNDTAYPQANHRSYLYQKGNVGYMFSVNDKNKKLLETFRFVGWN